MRKLLGDIAGECSRFLGVGGFCVLRSFCGFYYVCEGVVGWGWDVRIIEVFRFRFFIL